jgi:hypothetical protein
VSRLREQLAAELAGKVNRYGVVVWNDPERAYREAVSDVLPPDAHDARYEGSWLSLRRDVEGLLVGDAPPRLVVYIDREAPDPDPLAELRTLGAEFRVLLPSLTKRTLAGQLTEHRIEQLASQCATLVDVEAALVGGDTSVDARLMVVTDGSSTHEIAERLLSGEVDAKLDERGLWAPAAEFFRQAIGGEYESLSHEDLWRAVFVRLTQLVILEALGSLPDGLGDSLGESTKAERNGARSIVRRLQGGVPAERFAALARDCEGAMHLALHLTWSDDLLDVDIAPVIEVLGTTAAIEHLTQGRFNRACLMAAYRIGHSWWVTGPDDEATTFAALWRAVSAVGHLGEALDESPPAATTLDGLLSWYVDRGWLVDSAFRRMELVRATAGLALDELDEVFHSVRLQYEHWLDEGIRAITSAVATGLDLSANQLQRTVHERKLKRSNEQTAYILVDALRYELGVDLADRLRRIAQEVHIGYAVATPPTITPVGMAALLPGAEASFSLGLDDDDRLEVRIAGSTVRTVRDRVALLEVAHGKVADVDLDWVAQARNADLKRKIDGTKVVLVRSTEIDTDGESDQLAASWASFDGTLNVLHTAVARLFHAGVRNVVITADHGFLAVRRLGDERKIDRPASGAGELHRRVWIGRGGSASDSTIKVSLADFGSAATST